MFATCLTKDIIRKSSDDNDNDNDKDKDHLSAAFPNRQTRLAKSFCKPLRKQSETRAVKLLPKRLSSWLIVIAILSACFALVSYRLTTLVLFALAGVAVAPIFLRMLFRKLINPIVGAQHPFGPAFSCCLPAVLYASLIPAYLGVARIFDNFTLSTEEMMGIAYTATMLGSFGGFVACATILPEEKVRANLWWNPLTLQASIINPIAIACSITVATFFDDATFLIPIFPAISISGVFFITAEREAGRSPDDGNVSNTSPSSSPEEL